MSIQKYKRENKLMRKIFIIMFIIIVSIIWIIPNILIKNLYENNNEKIAKYEDVISVKKSKGIISYNIMDLAKIVQLTNTQYIQLSDDKVIYENNETVNLNIPEYDQEDNYKVEIYLNDKKEKEEVVTENEKSIDIEIDKEQKNLIKVCLYKNQDMIEEKDKEFYYINPYQKQFLDELSKYGVTTHYNKEADDIKETIDLLKNSGIKNIKNSIRWDLIGKRSENTFEETDEWINNVKNANINIIPILIDTYHRYTGNDHIVSNDKELEGFVDYVKQIYEKYGDCIKEVEVWNEPNLQYKTDEQREWYSKIVEGINKLNSKYKIITGSTSVGYPTSHSEEYITDLSKYGVYDNSNVFSCHIYSNSEEMEWLREKDISHKNMINELGGFQNLYLTEYGVPTRILSDEDNRASMIIKQTVVNDSLGIDSSILYSLIDDDSETNNYGIITKDSLPKNSYFGMKNFLTNTNGAEYIGKVNLKDNLETYVYDKDGKPKIIMWTTNKNTTTTIPYQRFTAKDIYGNDIQADETGNLTITNSAVYLDNISREYFYQAISNIIKEKVTEFETKFIDEIPKVNGLSEKLEQQKQIAEDIGTHNEESEILEDTSIQYMKDFYKVGSIIIENYKNGSLEVEDVKLSSMLDSLNDIGNSYEDLVTITAQTRNANFEETNKKIETAENVINNGKDLDNIYPSKILDFAKEFNEKATYINNLDEENEIKTGLIVSKNLHANLLADWTKQFEDIYIDKYLQENPVQEITYSTEDGQEYQIENFTNKNVIATLPTTEDMQITSEGGNTHTFEQNGSFTFKYTRRGRNFEVAIKIENIDKDAPIITGVENNKLYTSQVSVNVEDKNLKEVIAIFNDKEINYTLNAPLKEEGIYVINAKDNAGNTAKKTFQLIENASEDYNVGDKYITNIQENTTAKELRKKLLSSLDYDIKRNGEKIDENEIVCTGDVIKTKDMHQNYTLIVAGDINQNGEVDIRDFVRLRRYLLRQIQLEGVEKLAADANVDNKEIGIKDFVRMKVILLSN